MQNRTKATSIPPKVREAVERRDSIDGVPACIFCHTTIGVRGEAHVISRAHGGLGVERNIICVCRSCHSRMDNSTYRDLYIKRAKEYLKSKYPDWSEKDLVYNKWEGFKYQ